MKRTDSRRALQANLSTWIGDFWAAAFLFVLITESSMFKPDDRRFFLFLIAGSLYLAIFERPRALKLLSEYRALLMAFLGLGLSIAVCELISTWLYHHDNTRLFIPYQVPMLLCAPILAAIWIRDRPLKWSFFCFTAIVVWHYLALPIEALTSWRLSWHPDAVKVREQWGLKFQASGLAHSNAYFAGLMFPLFYLTLGPLRSQSIPIPLAIQKRLTLRTSAVLAFLWIIVCLAAQSRSIFIGSLLASTLFIFGDSKKARKLAKKFIPWILLIGAGIYIGFLSGKSSATLRWVFIELYFRESLKWPYIIWGHGQPYNNNHLGVPGYQFLVHSHNDFAQVAFWWGWATLLTYLIFWYQLLRRIWRDYVKRWEVWPLAAVLAVLPHFLSDLGLHHFEKVAFIVILSALVIALDARKRLKLA
jgi:hypothetical protein